MNEALKLLSELTFCTLSTVNEDGTPWGSPVFFALDENKPIIYWWSAINAVHSQNVDRTGEVFITSYGHNSSEENAWGAYLKAAVKRVEEPALFAKAAATYNAKAKVFKLNEENALGDAPSRIYAATPAQFWVNGEGSQDGHYIDVRREVG